MALPEPMIGAPVSATGVIAYGPIGSVLPADASAALDEAFETLGLVGEDGVTMTPERSREDKRAMGGQIVRTVQSEYGVSVSFTLLESTKAAVLKALFGEDNVEVQGSAISVRHNEQVPAKGVFVVTLKDGKNRRRLVAANAQLLMEGDVQYVHSELIQYSVTVTCYPDEDNDNLREYIALDVAP